jgi:hypothetical protein
MTIYLAFMHSDAQSQPDEVEWSAFFAEAEASGMFRGGSALGGPIRLRRDGIPGAASAISGFMRFETGSLDALRRLLETHPWYRHGGTIELRPLEQD